MQQMNRVPMVHVNRWISFSLILALVLPLSVRAAAHYDVVVIGGTPAGIAAAIAAGRLGKTVMLVEQAPMLGGMLSAGGLSLADDGVVEATSGVFAEFRQRVKHYHLTELKDDPVVQRHLAKPRGRWSAVEGQVWEPKTAARIYAEMVGEVPTISTRLGEVPVSAIVKGDRVVAVITRDYHPDGRRGAQHRYDGRIIVDATYEGDVAAFAKVPFRIGREGRSRQEPHAGTIYTDAWCWGERALPGTIFPGSTGEADERMQAFNFRLTLKDYGRADHPYRLQTPPPGYEATNYKWSAVTLQPFLPNGKVDLNGISWANELAGLSTRYVLADWEERAELEKTFRNYSLGWLYYIQNEGSSPQWGLAEDEFTDNGHMAYRLYVREGRRIEGLYTLTESDIHKDLRGNGLRGPLHADSIAIGTYAMDSHTVQAPTDHDSACPGEGTLFLREVAGPYQIPYGVMLPRHRQGLLVPVAISSTHLAMSSVRMEPIWSALGHAAGLAAALALDGQRELNAVPVEVIQEALLQQGSMLFFYKDLSGEAPEFQAVQELSLLGAMDGDENYYFRSEQPITLGEFARLAVVGLDIPLSITAAHFEDVPREHPAFKYIETLYDHSTRSSKPFLPYEVRDYLNYWSWWSLSSADLGPAASLRGAPAFAYPEQEVTGGTAAKIVSGVLQKPVSALKQNHFLTRGEAARLIHRLREEVEAADTLD